MNRVTSNALLALVGKPRIVVADCNQIHQQDIVRMFFWHDMENSSFRCFVADYGTH